MDDMDLHMDYEDEMDDKKSPSGSSRRPNKHLVEKRRRDRINGSLNELKALVLDALNKDESKYSKLEKADILEMTVQHLKAMQRRQLNVAASVDPSVASKYRTGFSECAQEVSRYMTSVDGMKPELKSRLMQHMSSSIQRIHTLEQQQQHMPVHCQPPTLQPIQVQIPQATALTSLPGSMGGSVVDLSQCGLQTVTLSPVQSQQIHQFTGAFQIVPNIASAGGMNPVTVFVPAANPNSLSPASSCSSQGYSLSPTISPEPTMAPPTDRVIRQMAFTPPTSMPQVASTLPTPVDRKNTVNVFAQSQGETQGIRVKEMMDRVGGKMNVYKRNVWRPW